MKLIEIKFITETSENVVICSSYTYYPKIKSIEFTELNKSKLRFNLKQFNVVYINGKILYQKPVDIIRAI